MSPARGALVAALGLFALAAQTLLFRDFLSSLESSEFAVGAFFGAWLAWVGIGAAAGRFLSARVPAAASRLPLISLLYLPAFLLQREGILAARQVLGLAPFVRVPVPGLLAIALPANVPVSFLTGFLFTLACAWARERAALPVARVYILETLGGFAGGLLVTALLGAGAPAETVFLCAAGLLASAVTAASLVPGTRGWARWVPAALVCLAFLLPASPAGRLWARHADRAQWGRLLPGDAYRGSFATAQARYLYGEREGDFIVVSGGGVIDSLPDAERAAQVAAWAVAQNPDAARVLVVGPGGLAVAETLRRLPGVRDAVWLCPDPAFPAAVLRALPAPLRQAAGGVEAPREEVRAYLRRATAPFDLVILNLPEPTTLVLNRYYTREFFSLVRDRLSPRGVCALRVSGGENYLGGERVRVGASALATLESVFPHVALKPGDESFLFASPSAGVLSQDAAELARRFAAVPGAAALYPEEGLLEAFPADRIAFQMDRYRRTLEQDGRAALLNTDDTPKALLFDLLLSLRRSGAGPLAGWVPVLAARGLWIALGGAALYALLRWVFLWRSPRPAAGGAAGAAARRSVRPYDAQAMLFLAGGGGMAASIVLMFGYQVRYGALFLHVGLITSLFMLGAWAGGLACERLLVRGWVAPRGLVLPLTLAQSCFLGLLVLAAGDAPRGVLAAFFAAAGFFSGAYFPLAARVLQAAGRPVEDSAGSLEMLDHAGGALGAMLAGLVFLPLLGARASVLILLAAAAAVNLPPRAAPAGGGEEGTAAGDRFDRVRRPLGYVLFGLGALALLSSGVVGAARGETEGEAFRRAAREMTAGAALEARTVGLPQGGALRYFSVAGGGGGEGAGGYVFPSRPLSRGIQGYGGQIPLAVWVDAQGVLQGFRVLRCRETPAYLAFLRPWMDRLRGRRLFDADPFRGEDAVTGATFSCAAIAKTLDASAKRFGTLALGREAPREEEGGGRAAGSGVGRFGALLAWTAAVLVLRTRPGVWTRRLILAVSAALFGAVLNLQYASQHTFGLLGGPWPAAALTGGFFLVVLVPVIAALFGNVYCGYLCPFGALQELAGDLRPARLAADPGKQVWRYGRLAKYLLLFLFVLLFAATRDLSVLGADPLITVFGSVRDRTATLLAGGVLLLAVFFRRFWCRNLCPAGAFLSLCGGLRLLRRWMPRTRPRACDMGVRSRRELDCLQCDRCRREKE